MAHLEDVDKVAAVAVAEHGMPTAGEAEAELLQLTKAARGQLRKLQAAGVTGVPRTRTTAKKGGEPGRSPGGRYDFPGAGSAAVGAAAATSVGYGAGEAGGDVALHLSPAAGALSAVASGTDRLMERSADRLMDRSAPVRAPGPAAVAAPMRGLAMAPLTGGKPFVLNEVSHAELPAPGVLRGREGLAELSRLLGNCQRCKLCHGRNNIVFADGSPDAWLAFVGEGPGADEDRLGRPFVGAAGQLLDRMIDAMAAEAKKRGHVELAGHLNRQAVYICNVVKCRPPGNRNPELDEMAACSPFLRRQLLALRPGLKAIVALGRTPTQYLLRSMAPISSLRGQFTPWEGIPVMPTYHPAYLLRTPSAKRQVWEDLQKVIEALAQLSPESAAQPSAPSP